MERTLVKKKTTVFDALRVYGMKAFQSTELLFHTILV